MQLRHPIRRLARLERELKHLQQNLEGVENMTTPPDAMFVVDSHTEQIAVREARRMGVPVVAVVDTNLRNGTDVNTEGQFKGSGHDGKDLTEIGFGTGGGMLVGGLIGGGKGMLIGGTIGATATVAHWLGKKRSAMLPAGTELVMELSRPLAMTAAAGGGQ